MVLKKFVGLLACTLILGSSLAMAGVPDLEESTASIPSHDHNLFLFNKLDATGSSFEAAVDMVTGVATSGVVTLYLRDASGAAIVNYPFEDLWLESRNDGSDNVLVACPGGNLADFSTDAAGMTEWRLPMAAGGYSVDLCQVMVNGDALTSDPGYDLYFISPDIDGNLVVGLNDLSEFAADYYGTYNYRSDFDQNLVVGLNDLSEFAASYYGVASSCQE